MCLKNWKLKVSEPEVKNMTDKVKILVVSRIEQNESRKNELYDLILDDFRIRRQQLPVFKKLDESYRLCF